MNQHSQFKNRHDNEPDWPEIWAEKFRKSLYALRKTGRDYTPIIKVFIKEINFHPKYVKPDTLRNFWAIQAPKQLKSIHMSLHTALQQSAVRYQIYS